MNIPHPERRTMPGLPALTLALLVGGLTLSPAFAADNRQAAVNQANEDIATCYANGGEPDAETNEANSSISVSCNYDDHEDFCVIFYNPPSTACGVFPHKAQTDSRGDLSSVSAQPIVHPGDDPPAASGEAPGRGHHGHRAKHQKGGQRQSHTH